MGRRARRLLLPLLPLLLAPASLAAQAPDAGAAASDTAAVLRIFFFSDAHSRTARVAALVDAANRARPDLVLEGGDIVHDGTEAEFRRAFAERARLEVPWHAVPGNHDVELRGAFRAPPPRFAPIRTVREGDLHVVLVDNHDERLTDEQFEELERALSQAAGARTVVVAHVPPLLGRKPATVRIRHLLPYRLANPSMPDPAQVERFTAMMERHGVLAVLSGHTHFPSQVTRGGVRYVVAGALGGLTPGLGIDNEWVEIALAGRAVEVRRVPVGRTPRDPVSFLARAFRFYAELNGFNHAEEGWGFVPSASVAVRAGAARLEHDGRARPVAVSGVEFERPLGAAGRHSFVADLAVRAGSATLLGEVGAGYRVRPLGDFNRGIVLGGGVGANAGVLGGRGTAGVGARLTGGAEWRHLAVEVGRGVATNHRETALGIGYRF